MTSRVNNAVKFQVSSFKFKFINEQQQKAIFFVEKHIWDNVKKKMRFSLFTNTTTTNRRK